MSSIVWNPMPVPVFDAAGDPAALAEAYFFLENTTTPLATYSDYSQTTPHAHPVVANGNGVFPAVYIPYSATGYKVRVTTAGDVTIFEIDGIARTAPPESGGGGGIDVAVEQVFQTGWITFLLQTGAVTGFVRLNGRTMGNGSSGATERANADTEDLFAYLWTNLANTEAAVSGGRGGSAAADFAANKTVTLPNFQGRTPLGLEGMGGTAVNVAQASTTIDTTNASPTASVASATGITIGMYVISANVTAGTTVSAVVGTTVTLSGNATGTASGTAARFSYVADPQVPGTLGGSATRTMVTAEMPSHTHIQDSHTHSAEVTSNTNVGFGAADTTVSGPEGVGATGGTIATNQNTGGGRPHGTFQPAIAGGFYIKL